MNDGKVISIFLVPAITLTFAALGLGSIPAVSLFLTRESIHEVIT